MSAAALLAGLSPAEKIGQLIVTAVGHHSSVRVDPTAAGPDALAGYPDAARQDRERVAELVRTYALGGVCYFPGRLDGSPPAEVAATVAAVTADARVPLLVSTDQEGGRVARLRGGFTRFGSALSMAATGDPAAVAEAAYVTGCELRAVGIDHAFSPVCDLHLNPRNPVIGTRSYGATAAGVAPYLAAVISGFRRAGVASTAKHFPGHGDTAVDSHRALPVLDQDLDTWRTGEGAAFAAAIAAGVDTVMTGHLVLRTLDARPATFSAPVVTGLLRTELGFDGVVVSDALEMTGAEGTVVDAVNAGVDQLLMPVDVAATVAELTAALADGRLTAARLDQACGRVLRLKERLGLLGPVPRSRPRVELGSHQPQAVALAAAAVTVLGPRPTPVTGPVAVRGPGADRLTEALIAADIAVAAGAARAVVLVDDQVPVDLAPDDVLVGTGLPDATAWPTDRTVLLTYGDTPTHLTALARVLRDPALARGRLPVPWASSAREPTDPAGRSIGTRALANDDRA